jgi:hypothetical protein
MEARGGSFLHEVSVTLRARCSPTAVRVTAISLVVGRDAGDQLLLRAPGMLPVPFGR